LAAAGTDAAGMDAAGADVAASILKSLAVGGGTFAGSGRGTAASIASSAAPARGVSDTPASAEVADTARKVAATAISTRSNPARFVEQSRIVTPPWAKTAPTWNSFQYRSSQHAPKRGPRSQPRSQSVRLHATIQPQTIHAPLSCSQRHAGNSRQTDLELPVWFRVARFCHASRPLSVTGKPRFKGSGTIDPLIRGRACRGSATIIRGRQILGVSSLTSVGGGHQFVGVSLSLARHPRNRRRQLHRVCDKASSARSSTGVRLRTSGRDNERSRSG
jgi:hypothetical protein